ncbi:MAG TPA: carboxypeptidase-like regulatory domain-containing protein [Gemmatimonadales bacterium]|nr:carboxypeptidase-like regulatory domain-containing protein [Gemmatimonadales bacterium]
MTGLVTAHEGTPLPGATLRIGCAGGGSAVVMLTDSTGHYVANLETGSDPFDGASGDVLCHFAEPAAENVRVQVDTLLGFARGPLLAALQFVDLHEP